MLLLPFNGVIAAKRVLMLSLLISVLINLFRSRSMSDSNLAHAVPRQGSFTPSLIASLKYALYILAPVLALAAYNYSSMLWSVYPKTSAAELWSDVFIPLLGMIGVVLARFSVQAILRISIAALVGFIVSALITVPGVLIIGIAQRTDFLYPIVHGEGQHSTVAVLMLIPMAYVYFQGVYQQRPLLKRIAWVALIFQLAVGYISFVRVFWLANVCVLITLWCGVRLIAAFNAHLVEPPRKQFFVLALLLLVHFLGYWVVGLQKPVNYLYETPAPAPQSMLQEQPQAMHAIPVSLSSAVSPYTAVLASAEPPSVRVTRTVEQPADQALPAPLETLLKNERYEIWRFWWQRILERPWLGYGFGMTVPPDYVRDQMPRYWPPLFGAHAHNRILDILAQTGALGLLVWCISHAVFMRRWFIELRVTEFNTALAASISFGLIVAYVAKSMTDDYMSRNPLLIYWLFIALFGMVRSHFAQEEP
jgi:hypothetical protein